MLMNIVCPTIRCSETLCLLTLETPHQCSTRLCHLIAVIWFPEVNVHKDPDGQRRRGGQMSNLKGLLENVRWKKKYIYLYVLFTVCGWAFCLVFFYCLYWLFSGSDDDRSSLIRKKVCFSVICKLFGSLSQLFVWLGRVSSVLDVLFPGERNRVLHAVPRCRGSHHDRAVSCLPCFCFQFLYV